MMSMRAERSKLHNFHLSPFLKWGNPRLLRCIKDKSDDNPSVVVLDRRSSVVMNEKGSSGKRGLRGSINQASFKKSPAAKGHKHDQGIEAFGRKLEFDLQKEADKVKKAVLKEGSVPALASAKANSPRPWNLRTRRAANKAPMERNGRGTSLKVDVKKSIAEKNRGKWKVSVALSKHEIEEDYLSMVGHPPPRRPKKRPKIVQNKLDSLFPGLWLTKIKPCMYKVVPDC